MKIRLFLLMVTLIISCKSKNTNVIMKIEKEIQFNVKKEKIWKLLTDPKMTKQYMFGCEVLSKWEIDSPIFWKGYTEEGKEVTYVKGKIIECERGNKVTFTMFDPNLGIEDIPENYLNLTYELTEINNKTVLKLTQENFDIVANGKKRYEESLKGWEMVIPIMKQLIEH